MQVSVEATGGLERRITVQVPADRIDQEVDKRLKSMAGRTRMDGFRPGKVPFKLIRNRYGKQVHLEVAGEVMQSSLYEALSQEKLRPAGMPQVEPKTVEPGQALEFSATFEVCPEFEVAGVDKIEVVKPVVEITDEDVDNMLLNLRKQRATWEAADRAAEEGDRVVIDFRGSIDGEPFAGGEGKQVPVILGSGIMIKGFEEKLMGAKAGDELGMDVDFPADYRVQSLAGKPAHFDIKVHSVTVARLPELDEDFARSFGVAEGGVDGLRKEVRENMTREMEQTVKNRIKEQITAGLMEYNELELPKALVDEEIERLRRQNEQQGGGGPSPLPGSLFEAQARQRVALGLLMGEVIRANDIKLDDARVRAEVERAAATYDTPEEVVNWYYGDKDRLRSMESLVMEDMVVEWLLERAKVRGEATSFEALMNPKDEAA